VTLAITTRSLAVAIVRRLARQRPFMANGMSLALQPGVQASLPVELSYEADRTDLLAM
jgi:hypothetical protein